MLDRARYLLVSEMATVGNLSEEKVEELVNHALLRIQIAKSKA
jgi:hypothetical protein